MKHKQTPEQLSTPILDYYNLSPWRKVCLVSKTILKIIYQKLRHPIQNYKSKKAEIAKHKDEPSTRSKLAMLFFCIFCGFLGGHRLYAKRYLSALIFFCTFGFFFLGVIFDLVLILKNRFKDGYDRTITKWRVPGDVLALLIALISIFVMTLMLPRALATITFFGCKAGEYFNLVDSGSCNERLIFDAFTSKFSGSLTEEVAPIIQSNKNDK